MIDTLKKIRDQFFTYRTFFWLLIIGFTWLVVATMQDQTREEEEAFRFMESCYAEGLVPAYTDMGPRCVPSDILVDPYNEPRT